MIVKTTIVRNGCSTAQRTPISDCLYRTLTSRHANVKARPWKRQSSRTLGSRLCRAGRIVVTGISGLLCTRVWTGRSHRGIRRPTTGWYRGYPTDSLSRGRNRRLTRAASEARCSSTATARSSSRAALHGLHRGVVARVRCAASSARSASSARVGAVGDGSDPVSASTRSASRRRSSRTSEPSRETARERLVGDHELGRVARRDAPALEQLERVHDVLAVRRRRAATGTSPRPDARRGRGSGGPRTGTTRGAASAPSPRRRGSRRSAATSGVARCADLHLRVDAGSGGRSSGGSAPSCARTAAASPGRRTKWRMRPRTTPYRGGTAPRSSCERAAPGPPELVGVARDHPVGPVLDGGQPGHARHPLRLAKHLRAPRGCTTTRVVASVLARGSRTSRPRAVIGDDHEVDPAGEVVAKPHVDEVCLVPDEQGHDDAHQGLRVAFRREQPEAPFQARRHARLELGDPPLELVDPAAHPDEVRLTEHGCVDGEGAVLGRGGPSERRRLARGDAAQARRGAAVSSTRLPEAVRSRPLRLRADQLGEDLAAPAALAVLVRERVVRRPGPCARPPRRRRTSRRRLPRARPLRSSCAAVRIGKWSTSIGYQPRIGTSPVPPTEWLPSTTSASGWRPVDHLAERAATGCAGSLIGACAASRSVMRSANGRPSSGTGTKWRTNDCTTP